jgi:hypothetical protein
LREVAQEDEDCNKYIQEKGLGIDLSNLIGELDRKIKLVADDLITKKTADDDILHLINYLNPIIGIADKRNSVITSFLIALSRFRDKIYSTVSTPMKVEINYIVPRFNQLLEAFKVANIFIFPKGEIEHYYTQSAIDYLNFTDKDKNTSFHVERDYILASYNTQELESNYADLISVLKASVPQIKVNLSKHLKFQIVEWLQTVQRAIAKGDIKEINGLRTNAKIDYKLFSQIIEVIDLQVQDDKRFVCKIKISKSLTNIDQEISFTETTIPHNFEFNI